MEIRTNDSKKINTFYRIGRDIRSAYNSDIAQLWNDTKNLEKMFSNPDQSASFFMIDTDEALGRVGIFTFEEKNIGAIGWYECCDDQEVANQLLGWATKELNKLGVSEIVGPIDGSTWYNYRFNLTTDRPLFAGDPFQPSYYPQQWEKFGFKLGSQYETTYSDHPPIDLLPPAEIDEHLKKINMRLERLTPEFFLSIQREMYDFLIRCFENNHYFSPITWEDYKVYTANVDKILDGQYSYAAMQGRRPIGIVTCLHDLYREEYTNMGEKDARFSGKKAILKTIATDPDWQGKQIGTAVMNAVHFTAKELGYDKVIHALMQVDNVSSREGRRKFHTVPAVKYGLYKIAPDGK